MWLHQRQSLSVWRRSELTLQVGCEMHSARKKFPKEQKQSLMRSLIFLSLFFIGERKIWFCDGFLSFTPSCKGQLRLGLCPLVSNWMWEARVMDLSFTKIHIFYIEPLLPEKYETVSASKYDFYPHAIFANARPFYWGL